MGVVRELLSSSAIVPVTWSCDMGSPFLSHCAAMGIPNFHGLLDAEG